MLLMLQKSKARAEKLILFYDFMNHTHVNKSYFSANAEKSGTFI